MSILFPKVNKPREWDYRPIYYDPQKEKRKERHNMHRGTFREMHEKNMSSQKQARQSKLVFYVALLILLLFLTYYVL